MALDGPSASWPAPSILRVQANGGRHSIKKAIDMFDQNHIRGEFISLLFFISCSNHLLDLEVESNGTLCSSTKISLFNNHHPFPPLSVSLVPSNSNPGRELPAARLYSIFWYARSKNDGTSRTKSRFNNHAMCIYFYSFACGSSFSPQISSFFLSSASISSPFWTKDHPLLTKL